MKKIIALISVILALTACKKTEKPFDSSICLDQMIERYKEELICTNQSNYAVHLYRGIYKNEFIYFPQLMCPNCSTMPPSTGYNCKGQKVRIISFQQVTENEKVYDSCTGEKTE